MSARHTAPHVSRGLERLGLTFRTFTLASEGVWSEEDADWNYKDVPHLNVVHSLARTVPAAIAEDMIVTINMQKMAGIPMPIALANYVASDGTQVYFTTLLFFVLVVETKIIPNDEEPESRPRTRVETTYHVGGPRLAMYSFPLLRRILSANYRVLMSEDLPMREQRGRLRLDGYRFRSDGRPRTFSETTDLTVCNVVTPALLPAIDATFDRSQLASPGASVSIGDGAAGVRFVRGPEKDVFVFDRVCQHEGANLDAAPLGAGCLVCPWHAKRVRPMASFNIVDTEDLELQAEPGYVIKLVGDQISVSTST